MENVNIIHKIPQEEIAAGISEGSSITSAISIVDADGACVKLVCHGNPPEQLSHHKNSITLSTHGIVTLTPEGVAALAAFIAEATA